MVKEIIVDPVYLKIAVMAAAVVGLYLLARATSRKGPEDMLSPPPPDVPSPMPISGPDGRELSDATYAPIPGAQTFAGRVVIQQHSFRSFDPLPGPPDPSDFMDDLLLVVHYPETGFTGEIEYTVATPAAISRAIASSPEKCVPLPPNSFVVARYDHDVIMRAVLAHLAGEQDPDQKDVFLNRQIGDQL